MVRFRRLILSLFAASCWASPPAFAADVPAGWLVHLALGGGGLGVPVYVNVPASGSAAAFTNGQDSIVVGPLIGAELYPLFTPFIGVALTGDVAIGLLPHVRTVDWADRERAGIKAFVGSEIGFAGLAQLQLGRERAADSDVSANGGNALQSGSGSLSFWDGSLGVRGCLSFDGQSRCPEFFEGVLFVQLVNDVVQRPWGLRLAWTRRNAFTWGAEVSFDGPFAGVARYTLAQTAAVTGSMFIAFSVDVGRRWR